MTTDAGAGQGSTLIEDAELTEVVAAECERLSVPGCAVGVVVGARSYVACYGVTDVDHPRPVDADTLFMIGSTSKTMTATALMTLVQDGRLTLEDRVVDHLPELALKDEQAREEVTVGHLLDHSAGWRGDLEIDTGWGEDALPRAATEVAATVPQLFAPGSMVSYNNLSLVLAGLLLGRLTGQGYEASVTTRVLEPLGMADTFFFPWEVASRPMATGHVVRDGRPRPTYVWPMSRGMNPAGGAISTLRDQLRYAQFHLDGTAPGPPPLSDDLRVQMQQPRVSLPSTLSGVGASWLLRDRDGLRMVTHGGNCSNLYVSGFSLAPDQGLAVTAMGSSKGGGAVAAAVTEWAVQHHLGRPAVPSREALKLTPELATQYIGRYDAGQWDLDVTHADGRLFVQMQLTDVAPDTPEEVLAAFRSPPTEVVLVAPDVLAPAGSTAESSGDFVRGADGAVTWLRYGLRLARRRGRLP